MLYTTIIGSDGVRFFRETRYPCGELSHAPLHDYGVAVILSTSGVCGGGGMGSGLGREARFSFHKKSAMDKEAFFGVDP